MNPQDITDRFAHQIGMGMMVYAQLEKDVLALYVAMSGTDFQTALRTWAALDYRPQRDILKSLASLKLEGLPEHGDFGRVLGEVSAANKTRNRLAHWGWALDRERQEMAWMSIENRSGFKVHYERTSYDALVASVNQIAAARSEVRALTERLQPALDAWHEKFR